MKTIYTSYFSNVKNLPSEVGPIAICGGIPDWWKGKWIRKLAPKLKFFTEWKKTHDNDYYIEHFNSEVLDKLNPDEILNEIEKESCGKIPCLICYETPEKFCHRHLVAEWLNAKLEGKVNCIEFNMDIIEEENSSFRIF